MTSEVGGRSNKFTVAPAQVNNTSTSANTFTKVDNSTPIRRHGLDTRQANSATQQTSTDKNTTTNINGSQSLLASNSNSNSNNNIPNPSASSPNTSKAPATSAQPRSSRCKPTFYAVKRKVKGTMRTQFGRCVIDASNSARMTVTLELVNNKVVALNRPYPSSFCWDNPLSVCSAFWSISSLPQLGTTWRPPKISTPAVANPSGTANAATTVAVSTNYSIDHNNNNDNTDDLPDPEDDPGDLPDVERRANSEIISDELLARMQKANFRASGISVPNVAQNFTGTDLVKLLRRPIPDMSKFPRWVVEALKKATQSGHLRLLKILQEMPREFQEKPIALAISDFQHCRSGQSTSASLPPSLRPKKAWAPTTSWKYLVDIQGALRLLPMYRQDAPSIMLKHDVLWNQAVKGARIAATEHSPNQPVAATYDKLCAAIENCTNTRNAAQIRCILILGWSAAARLGCIRQLQVNDLEFEGKNLHITFRRGKSVRARKTHYTVTTSINNPAWLKELKAYLRTRDKWLFPQNLSEPALRKPLKEAGLEQRSLRRGALQAMAATGVTPPILMNFSGHSNETMLNRYLDFGKKRFDLKKASSAAAAALWPGEISEDEEEQEQSDTEL